MIIDHISNIERYRNLDPAIYEGLKFLSEATDNITVGKHTISDRVFVNVQDYSTLIVNPVGYETHRTHIDIQYIFGADEYINVRRIEDMAVTTPYNSEKDVTLYADDSKEATRVRIGHGYFAILYPNDAHMPQLATEGTPMPARKAIVKVLI
ncbi:MAG: YhcH/YjgK/YiaL family protein [Bacteroidales bacterium]|nr:YhcH/YjgK/YiaL family protein [Candidatus Colimorpha onthohippi]